MAQNDTPRKALVLAGGGARGSYQVGVWRALTELGWNPQIITGTSVGSLNGAMFALDLYETARDMWTSIRSQDVMELPEETRNLTELHQFLRDVVRAGGMDVTPLEEIVERVLDEDALRASPIRFGLVTVEKRGLKPRELPLEEIPKGKVKDYLLASAACFPALRPYEIDGVKYIDGGWRDNMPLELAAKMGATELIGVDVDGVGLTRPNLTGLPTRIIRSHWNLGPTLDFAPERAARNIALGYFDTMRLFDRMGGTAYGILPDSSAFLKNFAERYQLRLAEVAARSPAIDLVEKTARQLANYPAPFAPNPSAPTAAALAPLELAAEHLNVPADMPYTPKLLAATVMGSFEKDPADRFPALLDGKDGSLVAEKAMAAAAPEEFVTALVSRTLADVPLF